MAHAAVLEDDRVITRAHLAEAMVQLIRSDASLAGAIAIQEAWDSGYVGRLLAQAEVLASQWVDDDLLPADATTAAEAVRRAVAIANPRDVLDTWGAPIGEDEREALVSLLQAQAMFHRRAGGFERRGLRRTPPPA